MEFSLKKMKYFGFRASVIKWFEPYLSNRKFLVCIDNVFSEAGTLKYGVPQGSILGPLLFLLYVNDLPQSLSNAGSYLYADDTYIYYQHEDVKKIVLKRLWHRCFPVNLATFLRKPFLACNFIKKDSGTGVFL